MSTISDAELKAVVEKVVGRTLRVGEARPADSTQIVTETAANVPNSKIVALGADHGGYPLKEKLALHLIEAGYHVITVYQSNKYIIRS